jgi:hypothetical protein
VGNKIVLTPLEEAVSQPKCLEVGLYQMAKALEK